MIAVAGLAVATTPDYAHYIPFFQGMSEHSNFTTGLATVLAPSAAATLFIVLALSLLHCKPICIHAHTAILTS